MSRKYILSVVAGLLMINITSAETDADKEYHLIIDEMNSKYVTELNFYLFKTSIALERKLRNYISRGYEIPGFDLSSIVGMERTYREPKRTLFEVIFFTNHESSFENISTRKACGKYWKEVRDRLFEEYASGIPEKMIELISQAESKNKELQLIKYSLLTLIFSYHENDDPWSGKTKVSTCEGFIPEEINYFRRSKPDEVSE